MTLNKMVYRFLIGATTIRVSHIISIKPLVDTNQSSYYPDGTSSSSRGQVQCRTVTLHNDIDSRLRRLSTRRYQHSSNTSAKDSRDGNVGYNTTIQGLIFVLWCVTSISYIFHKFFISVAMFAVLFSYNRFNIEPL